MATWTVGTGGNFATITAAMASGQLKAADRINLLSGYHNGQETVTVSSLLIVGNATNAPITLQLGPQVAAIDLGSALGTAPIVIRDNPGSNTIVGNSGSNTITVSGGADAVHGRNGVDRLVVNYNSNTGIVTTGPTANATGGYDGKFDAGAPQVNFTGIEHFSITNIGTGNDNIITRDGIDIINSGAGNDLINCGRGKDTVDGGTGSDVLDYRSFTQTIAVTLNGAVNTAVKVRGVVEDTIKNIEGIFGGSANDTLVGDGLVNGLSAGAGDDFVRGGGGNDTLDGGAGIDAVDYRDKSQAVAVTLNGSTGVVVTVNGINEDTIRNFEHVYGGLAADTLTGDALANLFRGGAGNDVLNGAGGIDIADYRDKTTSLVLTLNGANSVVVKVNNVDEDTIRNFEQVYGGTAADTLTGDALANLFRGGGGNDVLNGAGGVDTADYTDKTTSVAVTLNGATNALVRVNNVAEDTIKNIENVIAGSGNDTLIGDALVNILTGNGGNDTLKGGLRKDTLDGGTGLDTADYSDKTQAVVTTLNGATNTLVRVNNVAEDTIKNIENVTGGSGADTLIGDIVANILSGGGRNDMLRGDGGNDALDGGSGFDTADYSDKTQAVVATLTGATNSIVTVNGVNEDTIKNIENLNGGRGGDTFIGNTLVNILSGNGGNDLLKGGLAADRLDGGAGVDGADYSDKTAAVTVTLNGATASVVKVNNANEDTISNIENVIGGSAIDTLTGDAFDNVFRGLAGSDVIDGGGGRDVADFSDKTTAVTATLNNGATVTVNVNGVGEDKITNVEGLIGGSAADTLTGDTLTNFFRGGAGNDNLEGGDARDTADYSDKTAAVVVDLDGANGVIVRVGGVDEDTIKTIESIIGGTAADSLTGDGQSNTFLGGAGRDVLDGQDGTDTADFSDKTTSVEVTLNGATNAFAKVNGINEDTLRSIESVTGGSGNDTLIGDTLNNSLRGGGGDDRLSAGAGNDVVAGGLDNDTLTGGTGRDLFLFDSALGPTNVDIVSDFVVADDFIGLDQGIFNIAGLQGTFPVQAFFAGTAAHDADDRIIYNAATGALSYDADGTGAIAAVQFATLAKNLALTAANMDLVQPLL